MPKNLIGDPASFPTQTAPLPGEPRTAGNLEAPLQNAADRAAFLNDRLLYLDPDKGGARRLRRFASVVDMKASTDFPDKSLALVDGVGLYQFDAASVIVEASPAIVTPTSLGVGDGRWIAIALGKGAFNVANGAPQLDGSGKLPTSRLAAGDVSERIVAGTVRGVPADFQLAYIAATATSASLSYVDVPGVAISVTAKAGDFLKLSLTGDITNTSAGFAAFRLLATYPDTSTAAVPGSDFRGHFNTAFQPMSIVCVLPIPADGVYGIKMQHAPIDAGVAQSRKVTLVGELYRP